MAESVVKAIVQGVHRNLSRLQTHLALSAVLAGGLCILSPVRARPDGSPRPAGAPTFYRDVSPILQQHCETCHREGGIAPMPLQTFAQAKAYAAAIAADAQNKSMPPWFAVSGIGHFSNDPSLTPEQITSLKRWAATGAPAGDAKDGPPPIHWAESWSIQQPDLILP